MDRYRPGYRRVFLWLIAIAAIWSLTMGFDLFPA